MVDINKNGKEKYVQGYAKHIYVVGQRTGQNLSTRKWIKYSWNEEK